MSYPKHLICYKGHFYFKVRVPVDLRDHFPSDFIKKSLKTTQLSIAKSQLTTIEHETMRIFTLLRTGILEEEMVKQLVDGVVPSRQRKPGRTPSPQTKPHYPMSKLITQYMLEKQPDWTPKTNMEMGGVFKLLQDILGDLDVTTITKRMMLELRANLMRFPANVYKRFPNYTVQQLLETDGLAAMSTKTVNKHVGAMNSLLGYCLKEGIVASNCAAGLKMSEKKRVDEERSPYTVAEVRDMVASLPRDPETPERFWIPLIGIYSGMRQNEICQLYVDDVVKVEGIWCISINDAKDKRLKNLPSERVIPIHPKLRDLGFLDYVDRTKQAKEARLWMNLTWNKINGYSNIFCKWYQRFNRENVSEDPKKVFHSFRHLVADTLKQSGVQDSLIAELLGHSHGNHAMTMSRYGKRYQPKVLLEALKHLDYGIEIKRLDL